MLRKILIIAGAVVVLGLLLIFLHPKKTVDQPTSATPTVKRFEITVQDRKVTSGTSAPTATQGDQVELVVTSDEDGELHLHGYDKKAQLKKGQPVTLSITADTAGRFEYELEDSSTVIGELTVNPK